MQNCKSLLQYSNNIWKLPLSWRKCKWAENVFFLRIENWELDSPLHSRSACGTLWAFSWACWSAWHTAHRPHRTPWGSAGGWEFLWCLLEKPGKGGQLLAKSALLSKRASPCCAPASPPSPGSSWRICHSQQSVTTAWLAKLTQTENWLKIQHAGTESLRVKWSKDSGVQKLQSFNLYI